MPLQKKVLRVKWCSCAEKKNGVFRRRGTLEAESEENETILMTRNLKKGLELCWICTHC